MTPKFALYFGAIIVIAVGADILFFDHRFTVFWTKKFVELIEYIAIWR
jgi:hypothetical protein